MILVVVEVLVVLANAAAIAAEVRFNVIKASEYHSDISRKDMYSIQIYSRKKIADFS